MTRIWAGLNAPPKFAGSRLENSPAARVGLNNPIDFGGRPATNFKPERSSARPSDTLQSSHHCINCVDLIIGHRSGGGPSETGGSSMNMQSQFAAKTAHHEELACAHDCSSSPSR